MAKNTKIPWCDHTFNGWIGCSKVSPGCLYCYAEHSTPARVMHIPWGRGHPRKRTSDATWRDPLKWNRKAQREGVRRRVFCASIADVFDDEVPASWRDDLFSLIKATPNLDWQLLTKRPQNIAAMLKEPLPVNVWLGTSIEDQTRADERIPLLLTIPATVHFLSIEPLLSPVTLPSQSGIDWAIVGGESGPNFRPMDLAWAYSLRDQCRSSGIAFFMKQVAARQKDDADIPADLFIREFPNERRTRTCQG